MKVVILGCGRVGSRLALLLERDGNEVSIIDSSPQAFERLPENFAGQTVLGTGIDVDVLKSAGIEEADAFAAVTNFDNTNIMACEVAKEIFHVGKVLARIYDPGRENFYHELGLETVCPTTLVATAVHGILSPKSEAQINSIVQEPATNVSTTRNTGSLSTVTARVASAEDAETGGPADGQSETAPEARKTPETKSGLRGLFQSK